MSGETRCRTNAVISATPSSRARTRSFASTRRRCTAAATKRTFAVGAEKATALLRLLLERPVCGPCVSEKVGIAVADIEPLLTRIKQTIDVESGTDHCRACGTSTLVFSLFRNV